MPGPLITTIDGKYLRPRLAASFLLEDGDQLAFVENNTAHSVPHLLAALEKKNRMREDVRYLIVTHVHLDHAGGTSALLKSCPNATVLAHPRAKRHLVDPSRLIDSAKAVYGDDVFAALYGRIDPIPDDRVQAVEDGEKIGFGSGQLEFLHTRGHANHHMCIWENRTRSLFSGDMFGLCYPDLQKSGLFIFPSTSPTDLDVEEARKSIERITALKPTQMMLTHFGSVTEVDSAKQQLLAHYDLTEKVLNIGLSTTLSGQDLKEKVRKDLEDGFFKLTAQFGIKDTKNFREYLELDIELNAAGISYAIEKKRAND